MGTFITQTLVAFGVFIVVDLLWLGVIAKNLYRDQLGSLMAENTVWPAAIVFYVLFVVGIVYFAINPGLEAESLSETLKNAALFGFFTYMTYELTNWAVIKDWPAMLVPIDIVWGVVLSSSVAWITYQILA